jgi:hypothetical protein
VGDLDGGVVADADDLCPDPAMPEAAPGRRLLPNGWAAGGSGGFEPGGSKGQARLVRGPEPGRRPGLFLRADRAAPWPGTGPREHGRQPRCDEGLDPDRSALNRVDRLTRAGRLDTVRALRRDRDPGRHGMRACAYR